MESKVGKAATPQTKNPCLMLEWTSLSVARPSKHTNHRRWPKVWQRKFCHLQTLTRNNKRQQQIRKRSKLSEEIAKCACSLSWIRTSRSVTLRSRNEKRSSRSWDYQQPRLWLSHRRKQRRQPRPIKPLQPSSRSNRHRLRSLSSFRRCDKVFSKHRW